MSEGEEAAGGMEAEEEPQAEQEEQLEGEQEEAGPVAEGDEDGAGADAGDADAAAAEGADAAEGDAGAAAAGEGEADAGAAYNDAAMLQESLPLEHDPTAEELGPTDMAELAENGAYGADGQQAEAGYDAAQQDGYQQDGYGAGAGADMQQGDAYGYGGQDPYAQQAYGDGAYAQGEAYDDPYAAGGHADDGGFAAQHASAAAAGAGGASGSARSLAEQMVAEEREKHEAQLKVEAKAREELEDMILRIEKHFKAEQAARKKAEELLQASIAAEMEGKTKVEEVLRKRATEQRVLEEERAAIKRERMALESMRQEFEGELQAARSEVAKAQEALAASEERIRATEQLERARLEADYQAKLNSMASDVERMREELGYRTLVMNQEMDKWRQQAAMTANVVLEAKNEVMERKKELDATKEKMDRLLDKLYVGRERGIELSGAIATNQRMMAMMQPGMFIGGLKQPPGAPAGTVKLPPLKQQQAVAAAPPHVYLSGPAVFDADAHGPHGTVRRAHSSNNLLGVGGELSPTGYNQGSYSDGQTSPPNHGGTKNGVNYAHVQSKFARDAAEKSMAAKVARQTRSGRAAKTKPDRFAEAERENARAAGMGRRWN